MAVQRPLATKLCGSDLIFDYLIHGSCLFTVDNACALRECSCLELGLL